MKKNFPTLLIIILLTITIFTGCEKPDYINTTEYNKEKTIEILRCFDEEDAEGLKKLFCNKIKDTEELNQQILDAFVFFEGKTISYTQKYSSSESESLEAGKTVKLRVYPDIQNIKTDKGKSYRIDYYSLIIYEKDNNLVGISKILITNEIGNECIIGSETAL